MSLVSATTGSDGVSSFLSGSGFSISGSSGNPDQFGSSIFQIQWRSVAQPWINYGGFPNNAFMIDSSGGFNKIINIPKAQLPSGEYDLVVELVGGAKKILRYAVSGSTATRTTTGPPPNTYQYQDIYLVPAFEHQNKNNPVGIPEFGPISGSIAG